LAKQGEINCFRRKNVLNLMCLRRLLLS